ncbi:zinc finger protein 184-like [Denticeps clupeoides]|uniref:C2H2-type domain-containing protein n=1 Tax=Denticeps clupeoides TaxID=299321 RepID=A0AAY4D4C7_9TELE|nr:zinc finger protein 184-like [Denticeps clupeoides]
MEGLSPPSNECAPYSSDSDQDSHGATTATTRQQRTSQRILARNPDNGSSADCDESGSDGVEWLLPEERADATEGVPDGGSNMEPSTEVADFDPPSKAKTQMKAKKDQLMCDECGMLLRCLAALLRHKRTHTGEKPYGCDECGKLFTTSTTLRIHQMSHNGTKDFMCSECGKMFTHQSYLSRHLLCHTDEKPHTCKECGKGFFRKYHLN